MKLSQLKGWRKWYVSWWLPNCPPHTPAVSHNTAHTIFTQDSLQKRWTHSHSLTHSHRNDLATISRPFKPTFFRYCRTLKNSGYPTLFLDIKTAFYSCNNKVSSAYVKLCSVCAICRLAEHPVLVYQNYILKHLTYIYQLQYVVRAVPVVRR